MSAIRMQKVATVLEREIASTIRAVFPMEESGVFTIRSLQILPDFSEARIHISTLGGVKDFVSRLNHARNRMQREIARKVLFKRFPQLVFFEDHTGEEAERLEMLLKEKA
ncbi:MAG: ribosome-binding factor A [Candidatus Peregrinibacteria bacterium]